VVELGYIAGTNLELSFLRDVGMEFSCRIGAAQDPGLGTKCTKGGSFLPQSARQNTCTKGQVFHRRYREKGAKKPARDLDSIRYLFVDRYET
jgi:hypothetical protein